MPALTINNRTNHAWTPEKHVHRLPLSSSANVQARAAAVAFCVHHDHIGTLHIIIIWLGNVFDGGKYVRVCVLCAVMELASMCMVCIILWCCCSMHSKYRQRLLWPTIWTSARYDQICSDASHVINTCFKLKYSEYCFTTYHLFMSNKEDKFHKIHEIILTGEIRTIQHSKAFYSKSVETTLKTRRMRLTYFVREFDVLWNEIWNINCPLWQLAQMYIFIFILLF